MKIREVEIENFRGIERLDLQFGDTVALIGENNTGKTSILDALRICLRDVRSRKGSAFDAYDFHLSDGRVDPLSAPPIRIRITFREDASGDWGRQTVAALQRAKIIQVDDDGKYAVIYEVRARHDPITGELVQDWQFLNGDGEPLKGVTDNAVSIMQGEAVFHYLAALRDAARHFDAKGPFWRPFLKATALTDEQKEEIEAKLKEVNDAVVASHRSFDQVLDGLNEVGRVVPLADGQRVSIEAVPGRMFDMLAKAQVYLGSAGGAKVPVGRHGEGTQSLAVLMLFNAFLKTWNSGTPIIALEEPEAHLHPSAVRALWQLVNTLPGQRIVSTHSGDLLSEVPVEAVRRLKRGTGGVSLHNLEVGALTPDQMRQFDFHVRHSRGELMFARCWLLVEGETEMTLLPEVARARGISLERLGVRCVAYRHADIETLIKAAANLGIAWCVLADSDAQGASDIRKVRTNLDGRAEADVLHMMPHPDIEQYLCSCGYAGVYEAFLNQQNRGRVTVPPGDPAYAGQLMKAIKDSRTFSKPAAAVTVARMIAEGRGDVPAVLEAALRAAVRFAEEG